MLTSRPPGARRLITKNNAATPWRGGLKVIICHHLAAIRYPQTYKPYVLESARAGGFAFRFFQVLASIRYPRWCIRCIWWPLSGKPATSQNLTFYPCPGDDQYPISLSNVQKKPPGATHV